MTNEKSILYIHVENREALAVTDGSLRLVPARGGAEISLERGSTEGPFSSGELDPGGYQLTVRFSGYIEEVYQINLPAGVSSKVVVLGRDGEPFYWMGGFKVYFESADNTILFAPRGQRAAETLSQILNEEGYAVGSEETDSVAGARPSPFIEVNLPQSDLESGSDAGRMVDAINQRMTERSIRARSAVPIRRGSAILHGLTNELFVQFREDVSRQRINRLIEPFGLSVLRAVRSSGNAFLLRSEQGPSYELLNTAQLLLQDEAVEVVEPEILSPLEPDLYTPSDPLYNLQTHIPLINGDDAWERLQNFGTDLHGGNSSVCIAIFDPHGVAPNHPDLTTNLPDGTPKLVTSFDFITYTNQTVGNLDGNHGTQVAGVAAAAFDNQGVAGIAANCRLIGAELPSPSTGIEMADAFLWAAGIDNGNNDPNFPPFPNQPADVIGNSWGSTGTALSVSLQNAFDRLTDEGRDGKGCVVVFSIGNLGYVQFSTQRTFAAYNRTIAVGASINSNPTTPVNSSQRDPNGNRNNIAVSVDTRALYSPFGPELDIVAPSHTCYNRRDGALVDPTTTTVQVGTGALDGCVGAANCLDYATSFGGTSHASPTVAGAAALIIAANPLLTWREVRAILRRTARRIDVNQANAIGQWVDNNGDGVAEFSQWYGYGRIDIDAAIEEALNMRVALLH